MKLTKNFRMLLSNTQKCNRQTLRRAGAPVEVRPATATG